MRVLLFLITFLVPAIAQSQLITTNPLFPKDDEPVTIYFNAAEGNKGLQGYTGDIYAHTGVLTDKSSTPTDWKYVIAVWSVNSEKAKLRRVDTDLWALDIDPGIRQFYGVPEGEEIEFMAFVFRSENGSLTGRETDGGDIFVQVYDEGLFVTLIRPTSEFFLADAGEQIPVEAHATFADSMQFLLNDDLLFSVAGNNLNFSFQAPDGGVNKGEIRAFASGNIATESFSFLIRGAEKIAELPDGVLQGINYQSETEVTLVLFAPQKEFVFVIGDFNDWTTDTDYLMNKTPDGNYFWLTISTVEPNREYVFQYFVDGEIRIADPYTNKTSDPWEDAAIEEAVYPNLIDYPSGYTTQIASVFESGRQPYEWQTEDFSAPDPDQLIIYELLVRDFLASHSFADLKDTLDYLENLGINAIELMPINEFEGNDSWGYNPSFYFAVDKYYGPADSLKSFIDEAHARGIAVILDMVLNHSYGQSPLVRLYWDSELRRPSSDNPWYNPVSPNPVFSWGYDFNHDSEHTRSFVDSVNHYWLKEFKFDGFRFDFTKGFTNTPGDGGAYDASRIAILKRMAGKIHEVNPDAYIILEHFADNAEEKELADDGMLIWGNLNYQYRIASKGFLGGGASDLSWISYKERGWNQPNLIGYMESHDEERLMYVTLQEGNAQNASHNLQDPEIALKRMELCANLFIPIPGPKMIWMFGELGYDFSINYNERVGKKPIRWNYYDEHYRKRLYQVYGSLARLKTNYPVFTTNDFELVVRDTVKRIHLNHPEMNVTVIGNFSTWTKTGTAEFQHTGWWYEYWTGDSIYVDDIGMRLILAPSEYRLYSDVRLVKPDILSGTDDAVDDPMNSNGLVRVFPNPFNNTLKIETLTSVSGENRMEVYSITGMKVWDHNFQGRNYESSVIEVNTSAWPPGLYLVRINGQGAEKILKTR